MKSKIETQISRNKKKISSPVQVSIWAEAVCDISTGGIKTDHSMADTRPQILNLKSLSTDMEPLCHC